MISATIVVLVILAAASAAKGLYGITLVALAYAVFCRYADRHFDQCESEYLAHPRSARQEPTSVNALKDQATEGGADKL